MKWSFSLGRVFDQCPRKWCYYQMAWHNAKDDLRKELFYLKQLSKISAWRGRLVDTIITTKIAPELNNGLIPKIENIYPMAVDLAKKQISFAKEKKYRSAGMTKSRAGLDYCALYDIEYSGSVDEKELNSAMEEVKQALTNLLNSELLKSITDNNGKCFTQRNLTFNFYGTTITCTPDMIVFYGNKAPTIIDWKVHYFAYKEYRSQLSLYALALGQSKSSVGFPAFSIKSPCEIELIEYQLLNNQQRLYSLEEQDLLDTEDYMYKSISKIKRFSNGLTGKDFNPLSFRSASNPKVCEACSFKMQCWKDTPPVQKNLFGGLSYA